MNSAYILGAFKAEDGKECKVGESSSQAGLVEEEETEQPQLCVPSQMQSTTIPKNQIHGNEEQSVSKVASHL